MFGSWGNVWCWCLGLEVGGGGVFGLWRELGIGMIGLSWGGVGSRLVCRYSESLGVLDGEERGVLVK